MKKQEINLTDEEKIDFLANLNINNKILEYIKSRESDLKFLVPVSTLIALSVGLGIASSALFPVIIVASTILFGIFEGYGAKLLNSEKQDFKKLSNGKISYHKYKQLIKSGELAKWEEQFKDQVLNKVEEIKGIKHEKYTQSVEKEIIKQVQNSLPKDASLDSEKIAQEVKKIIESNNTQSNQSNDLQK